MAHQVLARKWRPSTFEHVVGQSHVTRALKHALDTGSLHHAYLFSGPRGVGKTSLARILAKCLNCTEGVSATPCGVCPACQHINEGRFIDLLEVDAASRTKVEDTRELLDNVQYVPTVGRYKIYLIDEVHMLSNHSFNALLKTLEEPPDYVKFILATTEPDRLPVTVLSRCLQFHLKLLSHAELSTQLADVLRIESIPYEQDAITQLARAAHGSMRDALSLMDQLIAYGGGRVSTQEAREMLGTIDSTVSMQLLSALVAKDGHKLLSTARELLNHGIAEDAILNALLVTFHGLACAQALGQADEQANDISELADQFSPEEVQIYYQTVLYGMRDLQYHTQPDIGLEMTLLRLLAFYLPDTDLSCEREWQISPKGTETSHRPGMVVAATEQVQPVPVQSVVDSGVVVDANEQAIVDNNMDAKQCTTPQSVPCTKQPVISQPPAGSNNNENLGSTDQPAGDETAPPIEDWSQCVAALTLTGLSKTLVSHCVLFSQQAQHVELHLAAQYAALHDKTREHDIAAALSQYLGTSISVHISITPAERAADTPANRQQAELAQKKANILQELRDNPNVQQLLETFDGKLDDTSIVLHTHASN